MNPRLLALLMILFAFKSAGQVCLSGILAASGPGCGCLAGCNLGPYGGPNCGSGTSGDCTGGYQLLTFTIPVPADCELKVSAIIQPLPGCSASGADGSGAGDRLKVEGSITKPFQVGGSNSTISDEVTQQGGTITITAYTNRADELVFYSVEYVSGSCPVCNILMPVELINFDASLIGDNLFFEWTTQTETDNRWFVIDESDDLRSWNEIYRCDGAGTTLEVHNYTATVGAKHTGTMYYRLRQIDTNGAMTTGPVVAVNLTQQSSPYIAFDHSDSSMRVILPDGHSGEYRLNVYTPDGRQYDSSNDEFSDEYSIPFNPQRGLSIVLLTDRYGEVVLKQKIYVD